MANARKTAPLQDDGAEVAELPLNKEKSNEEMALERQFDPRKKYSFQLVEENPERELPVIDVQSRRPVPHKRFKPFQNLVYTSQVIWNGQRRVIRYYDGCSSIFVDEQPKEKETIDQFIAQTKRRQFLDGKLVVEGNERMLLLYLLIAGWNAESPFRTKSANMIYVSVDGLKIATKESARIAKIEEALAFASLATKEKMLIHAEYLGLPTKDEDTDNDLSEDEVRAYYRKSALEDADEFIRSYNDKTIEIQIYIQKAVHSGEIVQPKGSSKVGWRSGREICDVSGITSMAGVERKLLEFSQLPEGEEFLIQLKAIYR